MAGKTGAAPNREHLLNTLAQNGTTDVQQYGGQPVAILKGKGADLRSASTQQKKARKKVITQALAKACMKLAELEGDGELKKRFRNTYYCQSQVVTHGGRLYGAYCKNRTCTICSGIRKADIINRYLPVMQQWEQPHFVTLTIKACKAGELAARFRDVLKVFREITGKYRKQEQRGRGTKLVGVKSLEAEFNPVKKTYNPHLHIITADKHTADVLVREWLLTWNGKYKKFTSPKAQKSEPVYSLGAALVEIIKYGTKIFTAKDVYDKANRKGDTIYAAAKYTIIKAMEGLRIFDRFGFDVRAEKVEREPAKVVTDYMVWRFLPQYHDWLSADHEAPLTGYVHSNTLQNLLEHGIDMETQ